MSSLSLSPLRTTSPVSPLQGGSPFPIFRLLLPRIDSARKKFGIKYSGLAKLYIDAMGLDPQHSSDAQRFLHYQDPNAGTSSV